MRVLLISHSYTDPGYWDKLDALGRRVELAVVTPEAWRGYLHPAAPVPVADGEAPWRQYRLPGLGHGRAFRFVYHPRHLGAVLAAYRPNIVHVEEEPESLSVLQLCMYRRVFGYRLVFFSWENVNPLPLGWPVRQVTFRVADAGIVGNTAARERCVRLGFRKPIAIIPQYGFDVDAQPRGVRPGSGPLRVGFAGRLVPEKGLRQLAEAARGSGAELVVAGSGPLEAELRDQPHIRMLGVLQRWEMERFWSRIDLLALPSLTTRGWAEQFGRVLVEAMGRGVPVLGSNSGAIPEVIGEAGLVVPEGDVAALTAVLRLLRDDPRLRDELSALGLARARECYSQDVIMEKTVMLYCDLLRAYAAA
jgi:glycosyltransferase involved in cell wall biosynthesis